MNALIVGRSSRSITCAERLRQEGTTVLVCDADEVGRTLERIDGRVDVLVTIVSDVRAEGSLETTSEEAFRGLLDTNLTAAFRASRACFVAMRARGAGAMVHVASAAGIRAEHESAADSIASAGVIALSELFAAEGAEHGIRANAVCPARDADIAGVVAWLACGQSAHVNGATIRVDDAAGAAMVVDTRA